MYTQHLAVTLVLLRTSLRLASTLLQTHTSSYPQIFGPEPRTFNPHLLNMLSGSKKTPRRFTLQDPIVVIDAEEVVASAEVVVVIAVVIVAVNVVSAVVVTVLLVKHQQQQQNE